MLDGRDGRFMGSICMCRCAFDVACDGVRMWCWAAVCVSTGDACTTMLFEVLVWVWWNVACGHSMVNSYACSRSALGIVLAAVQASFWDLYLPAVTTHKLS